MPKYDVAMTLTVEAESADNAALIAENFQRLTTLFDDWNDDPGMFGFIPNYGAAPGKLESIEVGLSHALYHAYPPLPILVEAETAEA